MPTRHEFGTILVESWVPFSSLPDAAANSDCLPDVLITQAAPARPAPLAWHHHWRLGDQSTTLSLAIEGRNLRLRVPALCDFLLLPDERRIEVSPLTTLEPCTVEHLLLDQVLPRWLALDGKIVLHAALLAIDDAGVLLLGDSGAGKSTLAAFVHAGGGEVLSDDAVVLEVSSGRFTALATYPSIRLNPDSHSRALGSRVVAMGPMAEYSDKVRVALPESRPSRSVPIRAIYQLGTDLGSDSSVRFTRLSPSAACIALIKQAFAMDLRDVAHMAPILRFHARLATEIPVFELAYPRRFDAVGYVLARIREHVTGLGQIPAASPVGDPKQHTIGGLATEEGAPVRD